MTRTSFVKHLDDLLVSYQLVNLGQMALNFEKETGGVRLKISTKKFKVLALNGAYIFHVCSNGHSIDDVNQFVYLCNVDFTEVVLSLMLPDAQFQKLMCAPLCRDILV